MNARAYFQILRPGRTFFAVVSGVLYILVYLVGLIRGPASGKLLLGLAIFGPVVLGNLLVGPIHEVMHRSFFPTLPDACQRLRRWHLYAVGVAAVVLFVPTAIFVGEIPPIALFGLIVAGLSLSVLDSQRKRQASIRVLLALIFVGFVVSDRVRSVVVMACQTVPWAFFIGGLAFATICFRRGFSAQNVRDRWRDPNFYCAQSTLVFVGTDIKLHAEAEGRQFAQRQNINLGRDWRGGVITDSLRDWRRVIRHARIGRTSKLKHVVGLALSGLFLAPLCFGFAYAMTKGSGGTRSLAQFCRLIVDSGKGGENVDWPQLWLLFTLLPVGACGLAWVAGTMAAIPVSSFPLSRGRLATCLFFEACWLATLVFLANVVATVLCIYATSRVGGVPFEARMLSTPLAVFAIQLPTIFLWISGNFVRGIFARIVLGTILGVGSLIGVIMVQVKYVSVVVSPSGLLLCVVATGLAGWVTWRTFQSFYRDCDLNNSGRMLKESGVGLGQA